MSILIKGMKMPENCEECQLCYDYIDCMAASHTIRINFDTRPKECPLVEVPTPHGRLIDADKLSVSVLDGMYSNDEYEDVIWEMVQDATTIIEAEGEEGI